jgi:hypothetical protein
MLKFIISFILILGTYHFYSFRAALLTSSFLFLYFIYELKLFSSTKFSLGYFPESDVFYSDYQGEYKDIGQKFENLKLIMNKFKLSQDCNYFFFGIYYDNPQVIKDVKNCRAVYGIGRSSQSPQGRDMEDYLLKNDFKKSSLPGTQSLTSLFEYIYKISMFIGIYKYYSALHTNLKDETFRRQFMVKGDFQGSVEIYRNNSIQFFRPYDHLPSFKLTSLPQPEYKQS